MFNYENCDIEDICAGATTQPPTSKPTDVAKDDMSKDVPASSHPYYPDLNRGTCLSDGKHSEYQTNLFPTLDACVSLLACSSQSLLQFCTQLLCCCCRLLACKHIQCHFDWLDRSECLARADTSTTPETTTPQTPSPQHPFYPDLASNTCLSDGQHSEWQVHLYTTFEECVSGRIFLLY